jgi:hypothetical protein
MAKGLGFVKVKGKQYDHDIVIHVDGAVTRREKKKSKDLKAEYGHTPLSDRELGFLVDEHPDVVYIGSGYEGHLPVTHVAKRLLDAYDIVIKPTSDIRKDIESETRRFCAIIHVAC